MSLFNLFGGNANTAPAPQQQQASGDAAQQSQQTPQQQGNGQQPTQQAGQQNGQVSGGAGQGNGDDPSVVDFSTLWENDANAQQGDQFDPARMFNIDPNAIQEQVSKINFAGQITPDQLSAISEGGEQGAQVLSDIINNAARQSFQAGLMGNASMMQKGFGQASQHFDKRVNQTVRTNQVSSAVRENPFYSDPAFKPVIDGLSQKIATKYPDASPQEVSKMTEEYFAGMAKKMGFQQAPKSDGNKGQSQEMDWEEFLMGDSNSSDDQW